MIDAFREGSLFNIVRYKNGTVDVTQDTGTLLDDIARVVGFSDIRPGDPLHTAYVTTW